SPPHGARRLLDVPADALAPCGAGVLALAADGVYRLADDARPERLGDRPPARALACGADQPVLTAVGVGAWMSEDGRTWRKSRFGLGRSFAGVASAGGRTWLAAEDGLFVWPDASDAVNVPPTASPERGPAPRPSWSWLLPRVAVSFDGWAERRDARAGWRLWVLITVTLGRRAPHAPFGS